MKYLEIIYLYFVFNAYFFSTKYIMFTVYSCQNYLQEIRNLWEKLSVKLYHFIYIELLLTAPPVYVYRGKKTCGLPQKSKDLHFKTTSKSVQRFNRERVTDREIDSYFRMYNNYCRRLRQHVCRLSL